MTAAPQRVYHFMKLRYYFGAFSAITIVVCVGSLFIRGLNFGLDFTGGTLVEVQFADPVVPDKVRSTLAGAGLPDAVVQNFGTERDVLIRVPPKAGESEATLGDHLRAALTSNYPGAEVRRSEFVGPAVGSELTESGGLAMLASLAIVTLYIMFRFTSKFAVGAVAALIHDTVVTVGAFSLFQWNFDLPALAAVLAVIGYSVNDTIVVADRIRENFRKLRRGTPIEVVDISMTQTMARTIMTSFTVFVVVLALLVAGGEAVHGFAQAMMVGVAFGTYSSTYVAAAITLALGNTREDLMLPEKGTAKDDAP